MLPILFRLTFSFIDEDFYGHIKAGYNELDLNITDRRFRVEGGYYVVFLPSTTEGINARVSDDKTTYKLFDRLLHNLIKFSTKHTSDCLPIVQIPKL